VSVRLDHRVLLQFDDTEAANGIFGLIVRVITTYYTMRDSLPFGSTPDEGEMGSKEQGAKAILYNSALHTNLKRHCIN
jgi:hypothetical protein